MPQCRKSSDFKHVTLLTLSHLSNIVSTTEDTEQPAEQTNFEEASGSSPPMEEDHSEDVKPFHPSPTSSEALLPQNSKGERPQESVFGIYSLWLHDVQT